MNFAAVPVESGFRGLLRAAEGAASGVCCSIVTQEVSWVR